MARINDNYLKLASGYLFPEIERRARVFQEQNRNAELIRLGIGDVVLPLPPAVREAMHRAVDELGDEETFRGYGPYEGYEFRQAHLLLFNFCNETLSAFYLDAVKDRLYCDRADSPRRRATQTVLRQLAELMCSLLSPILPHTADEVWRALTGPRQAGDEEGSIHLRTVPEVPQPGVDPG